MARPRTKRRMDQQVYIANESFVAKQPNGQDKSYMQGLTRVYDDDPILDVCPQHFDLIEDHMAVHEQTV